MKKIDKYILYSMFYLPVALLFCYFTYQICFGKKTEELILEQDLNESFTGNIDSFYRDKRNHNVKVAILSNSYRYEIPPLWESKLQKGDSLSKKKGSLIVTVYRNENVQVVLDYKNIYKKVMTTR